MKMSAEDRKRYEQKAKNLALVVHVVGGIYGVNMTCVMEALARQDKRLAAIEAVLGIEETEPRPGVMDEQEE
jgi:hypothetical protein